jgi:serine/threonine protein kinase
LRAPLNRTASRSRYRIVEIVGQGGMGSIYRAEDLPYRALRALGEVQIDPNSDPWQVQAREQFYREATILTPDHANLQSIRFL